MQKIKTTVKKTIGIFGKKVCQYGSEHCLSLHWFSAQRTADCKKVS